MAFLKDHSYPLPLEPFAKKECSRCFTVFLEAEGVGGTALQLTVWSQHRDCSAAASLYLFPLPEFIQLMIQLIITQLHLC